MRPTPVSDSAQRGLVLYVRIADHHIAAGVRAVVRNRFAQGAQQLGIHIGIAQALIRQISDRRRYVPRRIIRARADEQDGGNDVGRQLLERQ